MIRATYIKAAVASLNLHYPSMRGTAWNYFFDAVLGDDWLISTPEDGFDNPPPTSNDSSAICTSFDTECHHICKEYLLSMS